MDSLGGVWVFGDYRNYFQNRVTLQLIAKGRELAADLGVPLAVVVLGDHVHAVAMEYVAHGAEVVIVGDRADLKAYDVETCASILDAWVRRYRPEVFLAGGTSFGREFFPRLAKRLNTGLSADCVGLRIDPEKRLLIQTTPSFGGRLLAEVATPHRRPQMATVHPGVFRERPHDAEAVGRVVYPDIPDLPEPRVRVIRSRRQQGVQAGLESAQVVVAGGRGLGRREHFDRLYELAALLEGEVGGTRPAVRAGWASEDRLVGQTGKSVKPRLLISVGTSGAVQYTAGIRSAETIIAINRDPNAPIFQMADLGLVGDAAVLLPMILDGLRRRL